MYTTHTHKPFSISPVAIAGGVAVVAALTIGTVALDVFEGDGPPPTERSVVAEAPPGGPVPARSLADGRPALTPQQSVRDSVTIFGPSAVVPSSLDGPPALTPQQSVRDSVTIFGPSVVVPSSVDGPPALTPQQSVRDSVTIFGPSAVVPSSKWHAIGG